MLIALLASSVPEVSQASPLVTVAPRTRISKLGELPRNLISNDDEIISDKNKVVSSQVKLSMLLRNIINHVSVMFPFIFQIKVGLKPRYVTRTALYGIEKEENYISGRIDAMVLLFYGKKAAQYSVKPKSKYHITDEELSSIESMLLSPRFCLC